MENTPENRIKFVAQYWGQEVLVAHRISSIDRYVVDMVGLLSLVNCESYLQLKSLLAVSDEDAINVAKIMGGKKDLVFIGRVMCSALFDNSESMSETQLYNSHCEAVDYLRTKGYAVPWIGLSVGKLIEYGWVKLIEDAK